MPGIFADVTADAAVTKERNGGDTFDADAELTLPRRCKRDRFLHARPPETASSSCSVNSAIFIVCHSRAPYDGREPPRPVGTRLAETRFRRCAVDHKSAPSRPSCAPRRRSENPRRTAQPQQRRNLMALPCVPSEQRTAGWQKQSSRGRKHDRARLAGGQDYEVRYEAR
jgi:hypothetical protein